MRRRPPGLPLLDHRLARAAVTGSATSSNSLFGALQVRVARDASLDPMLLASANTSGEVLGKIVSPQNLAIGAPRVASEVGKATSSGG